MSVRRDKTVIENHLLNIMEKTIEIQKVTLDLYAKMGRSAVSKEELQHLSKLITLLVMDFGKMML